VSRAKQCPMKVLHLSACDFGGAGTAAYRLHNALRERNFDSRMLVLEKRSNDRDVITFAKAGILFKLGTLLKKAVLKLSTDHNYHFQDQRRTVASDPQELLESVGFKPDFIIAHWTSNFVSFETIVGLQQCTGASVLWYLMDTAPLTGGCHYAWDCDGYTLECGKCPALRSQRKNDLSHRVIVEKLRALEGVNGTVVAASSRLEEQSKRSAVFNGKRRSKILLGIDPLVFSPPKNRPIVRRELGLPEEGIVIFSGALNKPMERKGSSYLLDALAFLGRMGIVEQSRVVLATAGSFGDIGLGDLPFDHHDLGVVKGDRGLAAAYQAADMYVCPSIEDSGPMMINESIMCGTPVVSFDMGVARDLVLTGVTGYRAKLRDSRDLAEGMKTLITMSLEMKSAMSVACRELALKLCHPDVQVSSFASLFMEISSASESRCSP
jgi:glycosyltransferase involved in cell wall biosynthesis